MIRGIGMDLERVERFHPLLEKEAFFLRAYTPQEQKYISVRSQKAETAAGIFCAKEALSKALGTGLFRMLFPQAEVLHDTNGAPYFAFHGEMARRMQGLRAHLSITHSGEYAAAYVILEEVENDSSR